MYSCLLVITANVPHTRFCCLPVSAPLSERSIELLHHAALNAAPTFELITASNSSTLSDTDSNLGIYISRQITPMTPTMAPTAQIPVFGASLISSHSEIAGLHFLFTRAHDSMSTFVDSGLYPGDTVDFFYGTTWRANGRVISPRLEIDGRVSYELFGTLEGHLNHGAWGVVSFIFYLGVSHAPCEPHTRPFNEPRKSGPLKVMYQVRDAEAWRALPVSGSVWKQFTGPPSRG
jgi:hypothetical protein